MTWGGPPPPYHPERPRSYSYHHSPYSHPPPSPYNTHPDHPPPSPYNRGHPGDHYHPPIPGHDPGLPPRHNAWSPHSGSPRHVRYHHPPSHPPPPPSHHPPSHHHYPRHPPPIVHRPQSPVHPRSPTPPPTPPSGPLPPGRHTYAPSEYYSRPPPPEPREPWSPRRGYLPPQESYGSPRPHYSPRPGGSPRPRGSPHPGSSPHPGEYPPPERNSNWRPRSRSPDHSAHYYEPDLSEHSEGSGGLTVPCLGGEGRPSNERFSPKLHLAPRSNRPLVRESGTPPRPPTYSPQDFRPPKSPRYHHRPNENSSYYNRSSVEEEKKTSESDKIVRAQTSSGSMLNPRPTRALSSTRPEPLKTESRASPFQGEIEREYSGDGDMKEEDCEHRASPLFEENKMNESLKQEDDQSEEAQAVDDIAMSPISYDREDPMTLMDLPDNILDLPISALGPHDDPALS
mmetsp:Transcript_6731/g.16431  ORF Transcript_6731/g.16431 Transcript_6731/m.16431 type:complete len:455 (+) Transcript_6731:328-1692(+)